MAIRPEAPSAKSYKTIVTVRVPTKALRVPTKALQRFSYTLDQTGRRTNIEELSGRVTDYTYDDLYRLIREQITDAVNGNYSASYQYDQVGNRLYETVDGVQTAYAYDDNDRLTQQGGTTYTYDANGNTLSETLDGISTTYTYDARNRMVNSANATGASSYAYDIHGIRSQKTAGGFTTRYLVDHNQPYAQVLAETAAGITTKQYTYGDDLLSQQYQGQSHFYHYDGLGSTRALSGTNGTITDTYNYIAFGEIHSQTGTTENNYLYTGEQRDSESGHVYLRARYYDPKRPSFTQMDTFLGIENEPATLHKYLYTPSDPVNFADPSGNLFIGNFFTAQNAQLEVGAAQTSSIAISLLNISARLMVTVGVSAIPSTVGVEPKLALKEARKILEAKVEVKARAKGRRKEDLLFHYTDAVAARRIAGSGCINVSEKYSGRLGNGIVKPPGAYATDIQPWEVSYTQSSLSALFFGGNTGVDVSNFVAVDGSGFTDVYNTPREFYKPGIPPECVDVTVMMHGKNLMLK